jgi:hypothetical protein
MGTGPLDPKTDSIQQAEKSQQDSSSASRDKRILVGVMYQQGHVPTGYPSAARRAGHHPDRGTVDIAIQNHVYYDVEYIPRSSSSEGANTFKDGARFQIHFFGGRENLEPDPSVSIDLTASLMPDPVGDNVEPEVALPGSFSADLQKTFRFDTNQSFTENLGGLSLNCPAAPKSLADAVKRLQRQASEKRVVLPDAGNIKTERGKGGKPVSANPRIEVVGGPGAEVRINSEGNTGIVIDHGDVILAGKIRINDSSPIKKHQITGIDIEPVDNPPIQGPIVAPHPKFLPDLGFINAIAPAALAIALVIDLVKHGSELE